MREAAIANFIGFFCLFVFVFFFISFRQTVDRTKGG